MKTADPAFTAQWNGVLRRWALVLLVLILAAIWAGWRLNAAAKRLAEAASAASTAMVAGPGDEPRVEYWTCTMHPQVRQAQPGRCPICSMSLTAKYFGSDEPGVLPAVESRVPSRSAGSTTAGAAGHEAAASVAKLWYRCTMPVCGDVGSDDPNSRCPVCGMKREPVGMVGGPAGADYETVLDERARRLAELAAEPVEARSLFKRIRTVGKIGYDETRFKYVSAWIDGRVDRLFADFTGMAVGQGEHLVEIYSPELLSAQEEFLQAARTAQGLAESENEQSRRSAEQLLSSARRKLELLGVTTEQIAGLERSGRPQTHLVIHAPLGGTIVGKRVTAGMYVKTGDILYEIADLTHVWLILEVYESDLPWIQPFQEVRVTADALPGEEFHGQIAFLDPFVDARTRTIKVRVNVDNPDLRLRPEMYVRADIRVPMGLGGRPAAPPLDVAYACPMHTWETAAAPADCPICLMAMVSVESLPGFKRSEPAGNVLSVPRSAILQTGTRALAYVEVEPGRYRGTEVVVGPLAQAADGVEYYPVLAGLEAGQRVVTRGNFAIDSQMQLAGKPSLLHRPQTAEQISCPVMGNPIDKEVFLDFRGVRIYFCCPPCIETFRADPDKYIPQLPRAVREKIAGPRPAEEADARHAEGGIVEQTVCPVMGNPIDKEVFLDFRGVRIYFCCPPCIRKFEADPGSYLMKLPEGLRSKIVQGGESGEQLP